MIQITKSDYIIKREICLINLHIMNLFILFEPEVLKQE